jgi:hypothetical protein
MVSPALQRNPSRDLGDTWSLFATLVEIVEKGETRQGIPYLLRNKLPYLAYA